MQGATRPLRMILVSPELHCYAATQIRHCSGIVIGIVAIMADLLLFSRSIKQEVDQAGRDLVAQYGVQLCIRMAALSILWGVSATYCGVTR